MLSPDVDSDYNGHGDTRLSSTTRGASLLPTEPRDLRFDPGHLIVSDSYTSSRAGLIYSPRLMGVFREKGGRLKGRTILLPSSGGLAKADVIFYVWKKLKKGVKFDYGCKNLALTPHIV